MAKFLIIAARGPELEIFNIEDQAGRKKFLDRLVAVSGSNFHGHDKVVASKIYESGDLSMYVSEYGSLKGKIINGIRTYIGTDSPDPIDEQKKT